MNRKLNKIIIATVFICIVNQNTVQAQTSIYKLHSLFIYNFTKHIQWNSIGENFTIGVYGSEPAFKEVESNFSGKKVAGKEIQVIKVNNTGDVRTSQVVYTPKSNKAKILNLFEDSNTGNTLFVSEDDLVKYGFPISFTINESKLGFKVSKKNIEASGLKISSSLLSLAEVVD